MERFPKHIAAVQESVKADELLDQLITARRVPGMAVAVLKEDKLLLHAGYGFANLESRHLVNPVKSQFRSASVSKPIAATALAKMVEEGKIELDASYYEYVSYFPKKKYDFTIRQLASHTAGIRGYRGKEYALNRPYSIRESLELFMDDPLLFKPGTSYNYNSFDWVLLSLAIEEVSGVPFEEYVNKNVLIPLGMADTKPEVPGELHLRNTEFYTKTAYGFRKAVEVDNRYKLAGGGYLSTASDLLLLGQSYLQNGLLDPLVRNEFLSPQKINGQSTYYGLGWEVSFDKQGRPYYGHTGNSVGGYSNFYIYPEQEAVVVILINCTDPKVQSELDNTIDLLMGSNKILS